MLVKGITDYDIVNYKKPSLFVVFPNCSLKCGDACQNKELLNASNYEISAAHIIDIYNKNPLTHALVCGGLEPFDNFDDLLNLIRVFRAVTNDDIVIYTGYNSYEILDEIKKLCIYDNIIIKFGRFILNSNERFDSTLGIILASDNQFAAKLNHQPQLVDAIKKNKGYCPCALMKDETTLCCCLDFREGEEDTCHCGLYTKE